MAAPVPVARVSAVQGQAYAKGEDGALRPLRAGDFVYEGESVVTGVASSVELATMDGQPFHLGANEALTMDAEVVAQIAPDAADSAVKVSGDEFRRIAAALSQGRSLDDLLEETAAGGTPGDAGGGPTFVRLLRITESVDPLNFEFETSRAGAADDLLSGGLGTAQNSVAETDPAPEVTPNRPPSASPDTYVMREDGGSITLDPLANDSDSDGGTLTVASIAGVALTPGVAQAIAVTGGTVNVSATGVITFTPDANYNGTINIPYTISDGQGGTATGNQTITVTPVNDAPTIDVTANAFTEDAAGTIAGAVAGTFTTQDQDGDALTVGWTGGSSPTDGGGHALYTLDAASGRVLLTQAGADYVNAGHTLPAIDLTVSDGSLTGHDIATPAVTLVNDAPVALSTPASGNEDTPITVSLSGTDVDGTMQGVTVTTLPSAGQGVLYLPDGITPVTAGTLLSPGDAAHLVFRPAPDFNGTVDIPFTVTDDGGAVSAPATASIIVNPVNDAPTIDVTANAFTEDAAGTIAGAVAGTFTTHDPDGDTLTVGWTGGASPTDGGGHALYTLDAASGGVLLTQAGADYVNAGHLLPAIELTVSDGSLTGHDSATPAVTLVNDPPVGVNDTIPVTEDTSVTRNVLGNDTDSEGDPLTITAASIDTDGNGTPDPLTLGLPTAIVDSSGKAIGTITVNSNGDVTFSPAADYTGPVPSLIYTPNDGTTDGTSATVGFGPIAPVNDAPTIDVTANTFTEDAVGTVAGAAAGTFTTHDQDGDTLTVSWTGGSSPTDGGGHALYTLDVATGQVLLTQAGADYVNAGHTLPAIDLTVGDGSLTGHDSATPAVTLVNDAPVADSSSITVAEESTNTPLGLAAPTDVDSASLTITVTGLPTLGTVTLADGMAVTNGMTLTAAQLMGLQYDAPADYNGTDAIGSFAYSVSDGTTTVTGGTTITVTPVNDAPTIDVTANAFTEDTAGTVAGAVAGTFTTHDQDGDALTVSWTGGSSPTDGGGHALYTLDGASGRVLLTQAGADYVNAGHTLPAIDLTVSDGSLTGQDSATPVVTLVNDPPVGVNDTIPVTEDTPVTRNVLGNDTDAEGDPLTITAASIDTDGDGVPDPLTLDTPTAIVDSSGKPIGTITVNSSGDVTFIPSADYTGPVPNLTYTPNDGTTDGASATVSFGPIAPVNDAPTIDVTANAFTEDAAGTIAGAVAGAVAGTFTTHDQDSDALTVGWTDGSSPTDGGGHALYTLEAATGRVLLTQAGADYVNAGQMLPAIDLTVSDGSLTGHDSATPAVTLVNDAPTIDVTANAFTEDARATAVGAVAGTFTTYDQDGDTLTVNWTGGSSPTDGGGHVLYTLDAATGRVLLTQAGAEYINAGHTLPAIDLTVSDGSLTGQDSATPVVTLVNDAPVALAAPASGNEDTPITVSLSGTDVDGTIQGVTVTTLPPAGQGVLYLPDGITPVTTGVVLSPGDAAHLVFRPAPDYNGPVQLAFTVTDNNGAVSVPATASITVTPVNDAPILDLDADNSTAPGTGYATSYAVGSAAGVAIAAADTRITDVDSTLIHSATLHLADARAGDLLSAGALPPGLQASAYDAASGVLTISGDASLATYQAALGGILFSSTSAVPGTSERHVEVTVNDGAADSNVAVTTITVGSPVTVTLSSTSASLATSLTGLRAEYYGYNDTRTSGNKTHADDTRYGNLDSISDMRSIIDGRNGGTAVVGSITAAGSAAPDAVFRATDINYGEINGSLGTNTSLTSGKLATFLHADAAAAASLSGSVGTTTDAGVRFIGYLDSPSGSYDIRIYSDDGFSLSIDGRSIASYDSIRSPGNSVVTNVDLAGGLHPIEILYWDQGGQAVLHIEFKPAGAPDSAYRDLGSGDLALVSPQGMTLGALQDIIADPAHPGQYLVRTGQEYTGTIANDHITGSDGRDILHGGVGNDALNGGANDDTLDGGAGNDTLTGGLGSDVFAWHLGDQGTAGAPARDTVTDFSKSTAAGSDDVLNLKDLLQGEAHPSSDTGIGNLDHYLHFEKSGSNTIVHVSSDGRFSAADSAAAITGKEDLQIVLQAVDLTTAGTDQQIIQDLLTKGKLVTD